MRFFTCLLASTALFYACSSDDASSADDSTNNSTELPESAGSDHVTVDKDKRTITVSSDSTTKAFCILHKRAFTWGNVPFEAYTETVPSTYVTRGDTLVVYFNGNTDDPHYYIGGSAEEIFGEWKNLECGEFEGLLYCSDEEEREFSAQYRDVVLTISENKFQEEFVYKPAYFKYDDYMNSFFMLDLYAILENASDFGVGVVLGGLLSPQLPSEIKAYEKKHDIEVLEVSKREKKFKLGGKDFELKVTKVERDSLDYTIAVTVAAGGKECSYEERQVNVTKDNCTDLTTDGLRNYDEDRNSNDSLFLQGTVLFTKGSHEFGECLTQLTSESSSSVAENSDDGIADPAKVVYGTLEDTRDGHVYKTVKIGTQNWMAENLNYLNDAVYSGCVKESLGGCEKYGRGYMWFSAMELLGHVECSDDSLSQFSEFIEPVHRGVCPEGWHIPNNAEWESLIEYVDAHNGDEAVGTSLKTDGWVDVDSLPVGTNRFGFSAVQGGRMDAERTSRTSCGFNGIIMTYPKNDSATSAQNMYRPDETGKGSYVAYGASFCSADGNVWTVGMNSDYRYDEDVRITGRYYAGCYVRCVEDK